MSFPITLRYPYPGFSRSPGLYSSFLIVAHYYLPYAGDASTCASEQPTNSTSDDVEACNVEQPLEKSGITSYTLLISANIKANIFSSYIYYIILRNALARCKNMY